MTVRIRGAISVGETGLCTETNKPDAATVLSAVLHGVGVRTRQQIAKMLPQLIRNPDRDGVLYADAEALIDSLTVRTPGTKRGAVTGSLAIELVRRGAGR